MNWRCSSSAGQVARDLGISPYSLHNWVQANRRQTKQSPGPLAEDERAELAWLRAEKAWWAKDKAELKMERDPQALRDPVGEGHDEPVLAVE